MGREPDSEDATGQRVSAKGCQGLAGSDRATASRMQGDGVQRRRDRMLLVANGEEPWGWLHD